MLSTDERADALRLQHTLPAGEPPVAVIARALAGKDGIPIFDAELLRAGNAAHLAALRALLGVVNNRLLVLPGNATTLYTGENFVLEIGGSDILNVAGMAHPYAFFGVSVNGFPINDGATLLYTVPAETGFMFFDDGSSTRSGSSWPVTL